MPNIEESEEIIKILQVYKASGSNLADTIKYIIKQAEGGYEVSYDGSMLLCPIGETGQAVIVTPSGLYLCAGVNCL
jgi:hypothetical protein